MIKTTNLNTNAFYHPCPFIPLTFISLVIFDIWDCTSHTSRWKLYLLCLKLLHYYIAQFLKYCFLICYTIPSISTPNGKPTEELMLSIWSSTHLDLSFDNWIKIPYCCGGEMKYLLKRAWATYLGLHWLKLMVISCLQIMSPSLLPLGCMLIQTLKIAHNYDLIASSYSSISLIIHLFHIQTQWNAS